MKTQAKLWVLAAFGGLTLSAAAQTPDLILNTFDTATEASQWARWWGNAIQRYEHDATVDADSNPSSGSLKATISFDPVYGVENQFAVLRQFDVINASLYTNLVFDLRWDPSSPTRPSGTDHGSLEYGFRSGNWGQTWIPGSTAIPTHGNWIHFELPINPTLANLDTVSGVVLKMWAGSALTGTATFWLDNVKLIAIRDTTPPPPPTMSIARPEPGLNLIPTDPSYIWQRQNIRTVSTANAWFDEYDPVTYAITISKYPDQTHNNFQTHMFLVPANNLPNGAGDSAPDYNAPHAIFWQIANNSSGGAYSRFAIKTNQPGGDSQIWGAGTLAVIGSTTPLGRWILTISAANEASITTPDGVVTNFTIPAESAAFFADQTQGHPLYAWFGIQPNSAAGIGKQAILSRVEIRREFNIIDDQFTEPTLNTTSWAVAAHHAGGVAAVPPNAIAWVKWTLPDVAFRLHQIDQLSTGAWPQSALIPAQVLDHKRVLVTPDPNFPNAFFRLEKPPGQ